MFITKRISLVRAVVYTIVQCSGAAVASVILKGVSILSLPPQFVAPTASVSPQVLPEEGSSVGVDTMGPACIVLPLMLLAPTAFPSIL